MKTRNRTTPECSFKEARVMEKICLCGYLYRKTLQLECSDDKCQPLYRINSNGNIRPQETE